MIEIKNRYINTILHTINSTNLHGANLHEADLRRADLHGANLHGADLRRADLHGADLRRANLCNANLHGANLCNADLHGANLCNADLREANFNNEKLKSNPIFIHGLNWPIIITNKYLLIGCQRHLFTEWQAFNDTQIEKMHVHALTFWQTYKPILMQFCDIQAMKTDETT